MSDIKKELRKTIIEKRNNLSQKDVEEKSKIITDRILGLEEYKNANVVMCYIDFKNEVSMRKFIETSLKAGKKIAVPVVTALAKSERELIASEICSLETGLEENHYGILEPKRDMIKIVEPCKIDFIIVPGVGFDVKKRRMGYGAGYYDRFTVKLRKDCLKVGAAFDMQILEEIPVDKHDIPVDVLISESRVFA